MKAIRTAILHGLKHGFWTPEQRVQNWDGEFGALAPYRCANCGPVWREPESDCVFRGSRYEPPEYAWYCRECGCRDVDTWETKYHVIGLKQTRREKTRLRRNNHANPLQQQ